jgi:hypothetical protein
MLLRWVSVLTVLVIAGEAQGQAPAESVTPDAARAELQRHAREELARRSVLTARIKLNQGMQDYSCAKAPFELAFELRDVDINCRSNRIRTRKAWRYCVDGLIYTPENIPRGWVEPPPLSESEARVEEICSAHDDERIVAAAKAEEARKARRQERERQQAELVQKRQERAEAAATRRRKARTADETERKGKQPSAEDANDGCECRPNPFDDEADLRKKEQCCKKRESSRDPGPSPSVKPSPFVDPFAE